MVKHLLEVSRRRKRRWALIKLFGWAAVGLVVLGGFISLFYVKSLRLREVRFTGAETLSREELAMEIKKIVSTRYFYLLPKDHILFLPKKEIADSLSNKYRIKEFSLSRKFPNILEIEIKERKPWAVWCHREGEKDSDELKSPAAETSGELTNCGVADRSGFVFAASPALSGSAVLKIIDARNTEMIGRYFAPSPDVAKIAFIIEKAEERLGEQITSVAPESGGVYHLFMEEGWYLIIDGGIKEEKSFENLLLALGKIGDRRGELQYIDLRFANKVFYKFRE
ncbi:MAG: FtsQ-type POTRA domain-containing protein [Patescibacteria group bacterium]